MKNWVLRRFKFLFLLWSLPAPTYAGKLLRYSTFLRAYQSRWSDVLKFRAKSMFFWGNYHIVCFFLRIAPQDIFSKIVNRHCVMAQACKVHSMLGLPTTYSANEWSECRYGYQVGCREIIQGPLARPICRSKCMLGTTRTKQRQPQWLPSGTSRRYWSAKVRNSSRQELASIGSLEPCQITHYYYNILWFFLTNY